MKILFDQGTPVPLRRFLTGHSVDTTFELGWADLENGALLDAAERLGYAMLITTDQNLRYQQNLSIRKITVLVLLSTSWPRIRLRVADIQASIDSAGPDAYVEIPI